jgi:CRISPR-associated protein Cas6/Csy4, subtype I-F/YPEST
MNRYYFAIRYLPENVSQELLAGRCIKTLHTIFTAAGKSIGVCFPEWTIESLGNSIAFVSPNQTDLKKLKGQYFFNMMVENYIFEISEILPVPVSCSEIRFFRNQRIAKLFLGEKQRRLARASRRSSTRCEQMRPEVLTTVFEVEPFHRVVIDSDNNQNRYILHLQKEITDEIVTADYCSYGVATNIKHRGTVPNLSLDNLSFML